MGVGPNHSRGQSDQQSVEPDRLEDPLPRLFLLESKRWSQYSRRFLRMVSTERVVAQKSASDARVSARLAERKRTDACQRGSCRGASRLVGSPRLCSGKHTKVIAAYLWGRMFNWWGMDKGFDPVSTEGASPGMSDGPL